MSDSNLLGSRRALWWYGFILFRIGSGTATTPNYVLVERHGRVVCAPVQMGSVSELGTQSDLFQCPNVLVHFSLCRRRRVVRTQLWSPIYFFNNILSYAGRYTQWTGSGRCMHQWNQPEPTMDGPCRFSKWNVNIDGFVSILIVVSFGGFWSLDWLVNCGGWWLRP